MISLISGGAKNGKSTFAEEVTIQRPGKRYYIATMVSTDEEDDERIRRHRENRKDKGFETIECPKSIGEIEADFSGTFILDSLTSLVQNHMFTEVAKGEFLCLSTPAVELAVSTELAVLIDKIKNANGSLVIVSDYIFGDVLPDDIGSVNFMEALAFAIRFVGEAADEIIEVAGGIPIYHKPIEKKKGAKMKEPDLQKRNIHI